MAAELNGSQILELIRFIRWSLEQSDFRFLEWIDSKAFALISLILSVQTISGEDLVELVAMPVQQLRDYWDDAQERYQAAIDAAERVLENVDVVNCTPEAKAGVLQLFSINAPRASRRNDYSYEQMAAAAFAILDTVKSHRELMEILRRMGQEVGTKGGVTEVRSNYVNLFLRFLYQSSKSDKAEQWLSGLYN